MHSPFVFDFILNVLNSGKHYAAPVEIEKIRSRLLNDQRPIQANDLGAGSRKARQKRTVKQLAKTSLKSKKYAQLLYQLAKHYQPRQVIELGTSLGITTLYLSEAIPGSEIITIEGNPSIAAVAR